MWSSPYFDPDFDSLPERIYGPPCRVNIDDQSLQDCTIVKIDSVNKQELLLEVVQALTDMNLIISKGYISSDGGWFMDVFYVKDELGNKVTDQRVINHIHQAIGSNSLSSPKSKSPRTTTKTSTTDTASSPLESPLDHQDHSTQPKAIEMTGKDRPGLLSEISATLADLHCNIVEAHAWTHNAHLACVAYISDQSTDTPIDDSRLHDIEDHLTSVLRATTTGAAKEGDNAASQEQVKPAGIPKWESSTTTKVERRLHQLMLSARDFDRPRSPASPVASVNLGLHDDHDHDHEEMRRTACIQIEGCVEKGYSIVTIQCRDRTRLMFDAVCTLTDMQYVIFHASIDSCGGYAYQEYFIRHIDGCALNTQGEKDRVIKCLEAAIERRVCEGVRLELCAYNRVGLLSDITRVLRENGLAVARADVATQGEKAVNVFYVRGISGNDINVDLDFLKSIKGEMGAIGRLAVTTNHCFQSSSPDDHDVPPNSSSSSSITTHHSRPKLSLGEMFKSHLIHGFHLLPLSN